MHKNQQRCRSISSLSALCGVVTVLMLIGSNTAARAEDKITLRGNVPAGSTWTFVQNEQTDMSSTMKANGQQQQMQQRGNRKVSGKVEVIEAVDGRATLLKVTFDRDSGGSMDNGQGQQMPMPFALAGQTVTMKCDPASGRVTHDAQQQGDPSIEQELTAIAQGDDILLPKEPVGVGDSWSPDPMQLAKRIGVDPQSSKIGSTLTLKEISDLNGRRVAVVAVELDVAGSMQQMSVQSKMAGTSMIDLQTGRAMKTDLGGTTAMSGLQQQQGPDGNTYVIEFKSEGKTTTKSETKLVSGGGGAGGGAIGGGAGPIGGAGGAGPINVNTPAPPGGGNPPGGASPAGTFTFRDESISLTFTSGPGAPASAGTITMGDKKFPVRIKSWDGSALAGSFESDGSEFQFTGKLAGDTLLFNTEGTEYKLKNVAAAKKNPLGR